MGQTQPHGEPGGVFVYGSVQIVVEQSALGGGGGNARMGGRKGIFGLFVEEPLGEVLGGKRGNSVWPDATIGDGAGEAGT